MVMRKLCDIHRCERVWEHKALTSTFLTDYFTDEFRDNQKMDLPTFASKIRRKFNMCPNQWKLRRALNFHIPYSSDGYASEILWTHGKI